MRSLFTALTLVLLAAAGQAQIFAVSLKDEKAAKKYKDHVTVINGESVVVGEGKYAIYLESGKIVWDGKGKNELWVADPADPSFVPYKYKGEDRVPANPKGVLEITGENIKSVRVLIQEQSLSGMAEEYRTRLAKIQEISTERDAAAKASRAWFMAHQRLISNYERLQNWLAGTCFPIAAKKIEKEIERQKKNVAADALAERLATAKASVHIVPTPTDLTQAALTTTDGKMTFHIQESLHARMVYRNEISDERAKALLEFAEEIIDGFRGDCVDPYLDDDFEDKIPDRMFVEWCFGPNELDQFEKFGMEYYRLDWSKDKNREAKLKLGGSDVLRALPPEMIHYWKYIEAIDLEGLIAHNLGHDLVRLQYNQSIGKPLSQEWMFEGLGFYLSLEFLGRNNVTCVDFKEGQYGKEKKKDGERKEQMGLRDFYNALALESGPSIDKLALKELYTFEDADVAKSWSFFDYMVKKEGKKGQLFLRAMCELSKDKATFIPKLREKANTIFELGGGDVFKALEKRWHDFAETGQETGDTARRKG